MDVEEFDRIRNDDIKVELHVASLEETIRQYRDQWIHHRMDGNRSPRRIVVRSKGRIDPGQP